MPTEERLAELVNRVSRADEAIKDAEKELRLAERAGTDVQPQVTRLNEAKAKIKRIKSAYSL